MPTTALSNKDAAPQTDFRSRIQKQLSSISDIVRRKPVITLAAIVESPHTRQAFESEARIVAAYNNQLLIPVSCKPGRNHVNAVFESLQATKEQLTLQYRSKPLKFLYNIFEHTGIPSLFHGLSRRRLNRRHSKQVNKSAELKMVGAGAEVKASQGSTQTIPGMDDGSFLASEISRTIEFLKKYGFHGITLLLSGADACSVDELRSLNHAYGELDDKNVKEFVAIATGTQELIENLEKSGMPPHSYVKSGPLNLTDAEAIQLLAELSEGWNLNWDQQAVGLLIESAKGSAEFLEKNMARIQGIVNLDPNREVDKHVVMEAIGGLQNEHRAATVHDVWARLSESEQDYLIAVAGVQNSQTPVNRVTVARELSLSVREAEATKQRLVGLNILVESPDYSSLCFASPEMGHYVRDFLSGHSRGLGAHDGTNPRHAIERSPNPDQSNTNALPAPPTEGNSLANKLSEAEKDTHLANTPDKAEKDTSLANKLSEAEKNVRTRKDEGSSSEKLNDGVQDRSTALDNGTRPAPKNLR